MQKKLLQEASVYNMEVSQACNASAFLPRCSRDSKIKKLDTSVWCVSDEISILHSIKGFAVRLHVSDYLAITFLTCPFLCVHEYLNTKAHCFSKEREQIERGSLECISVEVKKMAIPASHHLII